MRRSLRLIVPLFVILTLQYSRVAAFFVRQPSSTTTSARRATKKEQVDVIVVGAGLGGLSAGAILNTLYDKKVAVFESHYLAGGCAHAFDRKADNGETFTFDSGPTILLG